MQSICVKYREGKEWSVTRGNNGDLIKIGAVRECICKEMTFQQKPERRVGVGERVLGRVKFGIFQVLKKAGLIGVQRARGSKAAKWHWINVKR